MRIIENTTEFHLENKSAVALGKFDGIHLGHRRLLERVLELDERLNRRLAGGNSFYAQKK